MSEREDRSPTVPEKNHELRTLMHNILGMVERLADTGLSASQRRTLKVIQDSGESLLELLDDFQPSSRVENIPRKLPAEGGPPGRFCAQVLLVEDDEINQEIVSEMLQQLDCTVHLVTDGRAAVEAVTSGSMFDVILMDCRLPIVDGWTATEEIRAYQEASSPRSHVPIIALTANALPGDRARCLLAGMDDYLSKPFDLNDLAEVMGRWLSAESAPLRDASPAVNWAALHELRAISPSLAEHAIELYRSDSLGLLEDLRVAVEKGGAAEIHHAAHALKSTSAQLGAAPLAEICREIEERGREKRLEGLETLLPRVESGLAEVHASLQEYRNSELTV